MAEIKQNPTQTQYMKMPMIALRGIVLFPDMVLRFDVSRPKSVEALHAAAEGDQLIFLAAQRDESVNNPHKEDIFEIGTVARIKQIVHSSPEMLSVLAEGICRAKIAAYRSVKPYLCVDVERLYDKSPATITKNTEALMRTAYRLFGEYGELNGNTTQELVVGALNKKLPGGLADYIASNTMMEYQTQQAALEELSEVLRLKRTVAELAHLNSVMELENEIEDKVRVSMDKNQREYFLKEQMRTISEELGEENEMDEYLAYKEKISALAVSDEIKEKLDKEAGKLIKMPPGSHESPIIRNYLDTVLELPWNKSVSKNYTVAQMKAILDKDHFGLQKVKDRILEHLAVGILAPEVTGQVLCLVGPPGTGKSSVARSIARAGGRNFAVVALGGVHDEADIRGHRKTYIGAMYGRIINALITAKSNNPVILLDEIDKLGNDYRGDPTSALLELLDSEQNTAFVDHYIEIPFDLSKVVFITTANNYEDIPDPLLDRMEMITLTSYTREEKRNIAVLHLIPKELKKHGLTKAQLKISNDAINAVCDLYTREAGVRGLEREIAAICRKTALAIASGEAEKLNVTAKNLEKLLGPAKFKPDPESVNGVGVATGLAWTSVGGDTLPIEVSVLDGTGRIELTGSLGDVMKESAKAAITFTRSKCAELGIDPDFYKNKDIHVHVPEGAVPKDGPSAGITIATAIISALTGRPVKKHLAMTGEITLTGRVLPIGGLKEKAMAAYRMGIKTVLIPEENKPDLSEIDEVVRQKLVFIPVAAMDAVIAAALD